MTYADFLTVALVADAVLDLKAEQISVTLPEPIGMVSVKAFPGGVSIATARELRFHGGGLLTFTDYRSLRSLATQRLF